MPQILTEFRHTFFRSSMIDVLIALLIGSKLTRTIDSILIDIIGPIFSHYVYNIDGLTFNLDLQGRNIDFTPVIVSITSFILSISLVFFFIIKPFKIYLEHIPKNEEEKEKEIEEKEKTKKIREDTLSSLKNIEKMLEYSSHRMRL